MFEHMHHAIQAWGPILSLQMHCLTHDVPAKHECLQSVSALSDAATHWNHNKMAGWSPKHRGQGLSVGRTSS